MPNDIDLSTEALIAHRAKAEAATPGPWNKYERSIYGPNFTYHIADLFPPESELHHSDAIHIAANSPDVVIAHIDEILRLRAEVERLEKEADWLATPCSGYVKKADVARWREAARKAVEKECQK